MTTLYISGCLWDSDRQVRCSLQSSVLLFIAKYCHSDIKVVFVSDSLPSKHTDNVCTHDINCLSDFNIECSPWQDLPCPVRNVSLPSIHQPEQRLVRSGLCVVLRHIIKDAHSRRPSLNFVDVLGYKQGCMKMCAEVSSWTKLCEVDIPQSVTHLISELQTNKESNTEKKCVTLPQELLTLEHHFNQKRLIHNDNKKYRAEIARLKELFNQCTETSAGEIHSHFTQEELIKKLNAAGMAQEQALSFDSFSFNGSHILIEQTVYLTHCERKFVVNRKFVDSDSNSNSNMCHNTATRNNNNKSDTVASSGNNTKESGTNNEVGCSDNVFDLSDLTAAIRDLSFKDVEYKHIYSEGIELTVADLILIVYIYQLLNAMDPVMLQSFSKCLPIIMRWTRHVLSLPRVHDAARCLGWDFCQLRESISSLSLETVSDQKETLDASCITFQIVEKDDDNEEVELSRSAKMKHRAIKPEVLQALKKFETVGIQAVTGPHPKGDNVQVDWDKLPDGVHPKQGSVPVKRTQRKCQQLENLATAVTEIAQPGDIVVDFCSGGGHLGILCAYLLPECQIYLVENKEESLLKASSRLQSLGLDNVTLYQCNMDYFIGQFGVGLCLHACGSATDMVLELCTKSQASFVICPCCYGGIHNTHLLEYPRSQLYLQANISYTDFLTIGHAADQTEFDIKLEQQGRSCMNLVDTDRAEYAKECGYDVTLCSLKPLTCSPKNNLLIGTIKRNGCQ